VVHTLVKIGGLVPTAAVAQVPVGDLSLNLGPLKLATMEFVMRQGGYMASLVVLCHVEHPGAAIAATVASPGVPMAQCSECPAAHIAGQMLAPVIDYLQLLGVPQVVHMEREVIEIAPAPVG
jgi:hypothetical protein